MRDPELARALEAAGSLASGLGLPVDGAVVLQNSNKLALRLHPCDVFARVAVVGHEVAGFEIELARVLAEHGSPVAALEPRVEPRVYERAGFAITLWTYYEPDPTRAVSAPAYADALARLHAGMRTIDLATPHFTDRVAEAQQLVASPAQTPTLADDDRAVLDRALRSSVRAVCHRTSTEQLLHGEPHPGNVLGTEHGPRFIDLETSCRGPVEFDVAHVPEDVSTHYPAVDRQLLGECRRLVLAMVAAWRWDADDQFPDGERSGRALVTALREGPPWPTADAAATRAAQ
jgi:Ser/Thr protein kinase RdoA (MazF antagonist)